MPSHLIFLPAQCDRPTLTVRDGMSEIYYRSVVEISRRINADPVHVDSQLRLMLAAGEIERMARRLSDDCIIAHFRLSSAWRLTRLDMKSPSNGRPINGHPQPGNGRPDKPRGVKRSRMLDGDSPADIIAVRTRHAILGGRDDA